MKGRKCRRCGYFTMFRVRCYWVCSECSHTELYSPSPEDGRTPYDKPRPNDPVQIESYYDDGSLKSLAIMTHAEWEKRVKNRIVVFGGEKTE